MVATCLPDLDLDTTLRALSSQPRALITIACAAKALSMSENEVLDVLAELESSGWIESIDAHDVMMIIVSSKGAERLGLELEPLDASDPFQLRFVRRGKADHQKADGHSDIYLETDISTGERQTSWMHTVKASEPEAEAEPTEEPTGTAWTGSDFYGSSDDFRKWLKRERPGLYVPEQQIVIALRGFDPTAHRRAGLCQKCETPYKTGKPRYCPACDWCAHCGGGFEAGSLLYCPECHGSGFDRRLAAQLRIVGTPTKIRPCTVSDATRSKIGRVSGQVLAKAANRKTRRAAKYARIALAEGAVSC